MLVLHYYLSYLLFYQQFLLQKIFLQKNRVQAAFLYSEKSLLAQCILFIDKLAIEIFLSSSFMDTKFLLSKKNWFDTSLEETLELEIFKRYLSARFLIENPLASDRCGQKFFTKNWISSLKKTNKSKLATKSIFL